jgi:peptidoglycan/LPS O-acetylase OafA/YrhL
MDVSIAPSQQLPLTDSARIPVLDGLRGVAILLVLMWHGLFSIPFKSPISSKILLLGTLSWSGVDLFFVLSGFLIGGILLDVRDSPRYFKTFYVRRAYRILPLYTVVIVLNLLWPTFVVSWVSRLGHFSGTEVPLLSLLTFTQNFWMAWSGGFGVITVRATWSLAVEEQFYLTIPFLVRRVGRYHFALVLSGIVVAAPLLRFLAHFMLWDGNFAAYVLTPCRADALCLGALCALLIRFPAYWQRLISRRVVLWCIAAPIVIVLAWISSKGYGPFAGFVMTASYSLLAIFYACFLLIALTSRGPVQRILCYPPLRNLGTIAYCTYLFHLPLMELCRRFIGLRFSYSSLATQFYSGLLGIALTLVIGKLSWSFFEKPLLQRGHAYRY